MDQLRDALREFVAERDWKQFHSPKNLAMALSVEAAEISEIFQWLTEQQSRELAAVKLQAVSDEIGDTLIYLVRLADELGIDPVAAAREKLEKNRRKYPADQVRGLALKYNEYGDQPDQPR
jgi:NTP pyrophosphatase (non-canonical NTP hydrolase)